MHTILCDVDQVVADLNTAICRLYNDEYNDDLTPERMTSWGWHDHVKPECGHKIYGLLKDPTLYANVQPIPGAVDGIRLLRACGHRVVFVTACAVGSMDQKARWLRNHGFLPGDQRSPVDFIAAKDKSLIRGDVLIDDAPHNVKACQALRPMPMATILVDQPHNREFYHHRRCRNWLEIVCHAREILR